MRMPVVALLVLVASVIPAAVAGDRPFPPKLLTAKTITVISHYGPTAGSHDPVKEAKFQAEAQEIIRRSQTLTLADDPAKSDLVLLLVGGYSEGFLGLKDRIVTGVVFSGGESTSANLVPLWVEIEKKGIRTHAAAAVCKAFLKQVQKASHASHASPSEPKPEAEQVAEVENKTELQEPESVETDEHSLPGEILQAKKIMVILRVWETVGPKGEEHEKSVEKEIRKWGRFTLVDKPEDADILIVCTRYFDQLGLYTNLMFENMMIFPGGTHAFKWNEVPLWSAFASDPPFGASAGTQEVRWLKKRIEQQEAVQSGPLHLH